MMMMMMVDNATTGVETRGIRHGFWVNDLGPLSGGRPQADTLPRQGAAAILPEPPGSARSPPPERCRASVELAVDGVACEEKPE